MTRDDLFRRLYDLADDLQKITKPTPPQLRGQYIGDDYYVRADDLAALLDAQGAMPHLAESLRKKARP